MRALGLLLTGLCLWQLLYWFVGDTAFASPLMVLQATVALLLDPKFWPHGTQSLLTLGVTVVIAWTSGLLLGVALGVSRVGAETAEPILASVYALPKLVFYPVVLLIFGIGMSAKVAFGVMNSVIPMVLLTMNAVRGLNPVYLRAARVMKLSRSETFRKIILPAALPEVLTAVRLAFSLAVIGVLLGEMFSAELGVGRLLLQSMHTHQVVQCVSLTLLVALAALAGNLLLLGMERAINCNMRNLHVFRKLTFRTKLV